MEISLEIVPRSLPSLKEDTALCPRYGDITGVNIPDLTRFPIRSWEACAAIRAAAGDLKLIPHLRARDFSPDQPFPLGARFREQGINRVLVIAGDEALEAGTPSPPGLVPGRPWSEASPTLGFIRKLKAELPELEIYAAFDPYRTNIRYELDYLAAKEEAGAAGFMSQPFFDTRLLEIYAEYLEGKNVFWGVAPVVTAGNKNYWESRNRAIFPRSFRPDLFWNISFARQVLDFCRRGRFNLYLMPINLDLKTYLAGLWPAPGNAG